MVGALMNDQVDLVATELSVTYDRSQVVDFTFPHNLSPQVMVIHNPGKSFKWFVYTKVIKWEMWTSLLVLVSVFLASARALGISSSLPRDWARALGYILCSLLNRELDFQPFRMSQKIFWVTVLLSSYVIFSLYCALFVSFLTVKSVDWPFTSLEELIQADYKVFLFNGETEKNY